HGDGLHVDCACGEKRLHLHARTPPSIRGLVGLHPDRPPVVLAFQRHADGTVPRPRARRLPSRTSPRCATLAAVSLLTELDAFFTEYLSCCGDLDAGVESSIVWIACECGARMAGEG